MPCFLYISFNLLTKYNTIIENTIKFTENISCLNTSSSEVSAKNVKILGLKPNLPCKFASPGTTG